MLCGYQLFNENLDFSGKDNFTISGGWVAEKKKEGENVKLENSQGSDWRKIMIT